MPFKVRLIVRLSMYSALTLSPHLISPPLVPTPLSCLVPHLVPPCLTLHIVPHFVYALSANRHRTRRSITAKSPLGGAGGDCGCQTDRATGLTGVSGGAHLSWAPIRSVRGRRAGVTSADPPAASSTAIPARARRDEPGCRYPKGGSASMQPVKVPFVGVGRL